MIAGVASVMHEEADRAWFADRIDELLPELYGTALRLSGDRTDAEDLVAEAVAKAWHALPSLHDREAFRGWLFRILNNAFVSQYRSTRFRKRHEVPAAGADDAFSLFERLHQPILLWWGNPELDFLNGLLRDDLARAIDALPDVFRTVCVMVDVQGLSYREVAELLCVPVGTVRSRLARARGLLQKALWEHALERGLRHGPPHPDEPNEAHERG